MSHGLPHHWFIEETGERLILDQALVSAELERLRAALKDMIALAKGGIVDPTREAAERLKRAQHVLDWQATIRSGDN